MKKILVCLAVMLAAAPLAQAQEEMVLVDEVVARVNKDIITLAEYRRAQQELKEELIRAGLTDRQLEEEYQRALKELLSNLIESQLLVQKADELGITVEEQVNRYLIEIANQNKIPPSKIDEMMRAMGMDPDQVRQMIRMRFLREAVIGREVYPNVFRNIFDKDVEEFYQKHLDDFTEASGVKLSEIFIKVGSRPRGQAQALAQELLNRIRAGEKFADLAKQYSEGSTAGDGGNLDWFNLDPKPELGEVQRQAIEGKPPGTVTDPVELPDGFRLFRVDERRDKKVKSLDPELKRKVTMSIAQERVPPAVKEYVDKLRQEAFVEIAEAYKPKEEKAAVPSPEKKP